MCQLILSAQACISLDLSDRRIGAAFKTAGHRPRKSSRNKQMLDFLIKNWRVEFNTKCGAFFRKKRQIN